MTFLDDLGRFGSKIQSLVWLEVLGFQRPARGGYHGVWCFRLTQGRCDGEYAMEIESGNLKRQTGDWGRVI